MINKIVCLFVSFCAIAIFSSCGSSGGGSSTASVDYTSIDVASGFSTAYLQSKSFYWPKNINLKFVETRTFTDSTVTWSDDVNNSAGKTASYTIVSSNGINGVIQYNDGVYDLFFNVQSVTSDHIMVCYTYTGIASVKACTAALAYPWYFDKATAEANYPTYP